MNDTEPRATEFSADDLDWQRYRELGLATAPEGLPPLQEGYARGVHITNPRLVEGILASGLGYQGQGMLMSTARVWGRPEEIEYTSEDPRFGPGTVDIIFDLTYEETKIHNRADTAPGFVSPDHIVGVINPYAQK